MNNVSVFGTTKWLDGPKQNFDKCLGGYIWIEVCY